MHKFPHPVTMATWELKSIYRSSLPVMTAITKILNPNFSDDLNPEYLCQEPTCLNLVRGSQPKDLRKRMVFSHLQRHPGVINTVFLSFLDITSSKQDELAAILFQLEPLHPRLCASIFESTPVGRAPGVIQNVERTKTLEKLVAQENDALFKAYIEMMSNCEDLDYAVRPKSLIEKN